MKALNNKDLINESKEKEIQQNNKKRFVDLSGLPRRIFCGRECIDWSNSVGMYIDFIYNDICGKIKILSYDIVNSNVIVSYNGNVLELRTSSIQKARISRLLGTYKDYFIYNIGDIVHGSKGRSIEILDRMRIKGDKHGASKIYKYRCTKDGYIGEISEKHLRKGGSCASCVGKKVSVGSNDVGTTHPEVVKYFLNKEDAKKHLCTSEKRIDVKCPVCKNVFESKIRYIVENGFSCKVCSDGISYPEKFMASVLNQLNIPFEKEKTFIWSCGKRYDFYLKEYNCLIEVHGIQHYEETFKKIGGRTIEEEKKNDLIKKDIAIKNNIHNYIEIDARRSKMEYISESIKKSKLSEIIKVGLENVCWELCHEYACSSNVYKVWELWNSGIKDLGEISKITNMSKSTIRGYLKRGREIGKCDYVSKREEERIIKDKVCELWNSGIKNIRRISKITNINESSVVSYLTKASEKGLCNYKEDMLNKIHIYKDGEFIGSYKSAVDIERISEEVFGEKLLYNSILNVCSGKRKSYKGYVFKDIRKESA